jgi:hypothetical protein
METLGFGTVYEAWVDFNHDDSPLSGCKSDLLTLKTKFPRMHLWGNFHGCGQLIDVDDVPR